MAQFDTQLQTRLHRPFAKQRDRTIAALMSQWHKYEPEEWDATELNAHKTSSKLSECGRHSALYTNTDTGEVVVSTARCKSRMCPRCNSIKSRQTEKAIKEHIDKIDSPRMLTLTVKSTDDPLKERVKHLYQSFAKLRRSKAYQRKIRGGVAVFEATWNAEKKQWHPHLHVLCDGDYWDKFNISKLWNSITKDSEIVHVKYLHKRSSAARYVSKYVSKIGETDGVPFDRVGELAYALHGLRVVQTSGSLYGCTKEKKVNDHAGKLEHVAPLGPLVEQASYGDARASRCLRALQFASKLKRPAGADALDRFDELRSRKALKFVWHWWDQQKKVGTDEPTPEPENRTVHDRPCHRTLRLWEDSEPAPSALAVE